jgi:hypothetical protein
MYRARGPPLPRSAANDSKGGDHMADLLHGFAEFLKEKYYYKKKD